MAEKYVIFKIEDWNEMIAQTKAFALGGVVLPPACAPLMELNNKMVADGVVIRRQDVFAGPALAAYANAIQLGLRVAGAVGIAAFNKGAETSSDTEEATRLLAIADYFHEQSELSYAENYKLPD